MTPFKSCAAAAKMWGIRPLKEENLCQKTAAAGMSILNYGNICVLWECDQRCVCTIYTLFFALLQRVARYGSQMRTQTKKGKIRTASSTSLITCNWTRETKTQSIAIAILLLYPIFSHITKTAIRASASHLIWISPAGDGNGNKHLNKMPGTIIRGYTRLNFTG